MKTKEVKRKEAFEREQNKIKSANGQLEKLNSENRRAVKERTKLAKIIGIDFEETHGYNYGGSSNHFDACLR